MDIVVIPDFISQEDAQALLELAQDKSQFEYFAPDRRYRIVNQPIDLIIQIVNKLSEPLKSLVQVETQVSDYILSIYEPGAFMQVHKDDTMPEYGRCYFTAVIYLNDDYEGGEIHFPEKDAKFKPEARTCIAFGGELDHGVLPVLSGTRYILGIGFTDDSKFFK